MGRECCGLSVAGLTAFNARRRENAITTVFSAEECGAIGTLRSEALTRAEPHAAGMENFCMAADWAQISIDDDSAKAAFESGRAPAEAVVCPPALNLLPG